MDSRWQGFQRLLLVSSRSPHYSIITDSLRSNIILITYQYETSSLNDIIGLIHQTIKRIRMESIGMIMHCSDSEMFISAKGEKAHVINLDTITSDKAIREFLNRLVATFLNFSSHTCRFDFLNASAGIIASSNIFLSKMENLLHVPIGLIKDLFGDEQPLDRANLEVQTVGSLYFDVEILKEKLKEENAQIARHHLDGYEKLRTVGKGAFGTAILYRKISDGSLVVIKEVNMTDLTAAERQMALNEVQVLRHLDHPNIISYLGSFEKDGVLMIEMEYADGGTLSQMLDQSARYLDERQIILLFRQIVSAIRYMHENNILHRDLKTANVFLNKQNIVKVGDFGISKIMNTKAQAQTVLGTPYYISPEMCEGKQYDQKSDIWALGCILYEMACLQKTFEGSNLPALVNKIMKGQFEPVPAGYSPRFRQLIHDLLQREPIFRPTAAEILDDRLPSILDALVQNQGGKYYREQEFKPDNGFDQSSRNDPIGNRNFKPQRSVLYDLKSYESAIALTPIQLPPRSKIKEVSLSGTHCIALTTELVVYTWGEGKRGQLGHGESENWREHPEPVEALRGKSIHRIGAGDGYSVFVSDSGMAMSCGDGTFGCLGHGDWNNSLRPRLIETLLSVDVADISCGPHHVVVLSGDGDMWTWGRGDGGRLALGHEHDECSPTKAVLPPGLVLRAVKCGSDTTAAISTEGQLYVCGRNSNNKLGLDERWTPLLPIATKEIATANTLTRVRGIVQRVADVSLGQEHMAVLTESGHVITMGSNRLGQLGRGSAPRAASHGPSIVKPMADKVVTMVQCGPSYTVAGTIENAIYFWGTRYGTLNTVDTAPPSNENTDISLAQSLENMNVQSQQYSNLLNASNQKSNQLTDLVMEPMELLALYASPNQIAKGETVSLAALFARKNSIFVLVDTTAPLARLQPTPEDITTDTKENSKDEHVANPRDKSNQSSNDPEMDSLGPVPDWIKAELAQSETPWTSFSYKPMNY